MLFLLLVYIALYVRDPYVRPIGGDMIVVIFLYTLVRSFINLSKVKTGLYVLLFAYGVELAQFCNIVDLLGLTGNRSAEIIMGTTFSWGDIAAYTIGVAIAICLDRR